MQNHHYDINRRSAQRSDAAKGMEIWVTPNERKQLFESASKGSGDEERPGSKSSTPRKLPEDWVYENIKDAIYHCRRIFYIYLGIMCYTLLTIGTQPTLDFFKGQLIKMPYFPKPMPLTYYLVLAPLLLIGFFTYKQLYLYKTNKLITYAIDECKKLNQDKCKPCQDKDRNCTQDRMCLQHLSRLYPWIIIYCRVRENGSNAESGKDRLNTLVGKAQRLFVSFSLWWLLPIILLLLSVFITKMHNIALSSFMVVVTCVGIAIVTVFWYLQQKFMNRPGKFLSSIPAVIIYCTTAIMLLFLLAFNIIAYQGKLPWRENMWNDHNKLFWMEAWICRYAFANLSHNIISKDSKMELANWINWENRRFEGANLSKTKLKNANLSFAHLTNAKLSLADLDGAMLSGVQATGADFSGAKLKKAQLEEAVLTEANFSNAKLQGAILNNAKLKGVDFSHADLSGAYLIGAQVRGARFNNANLQNAFVQAIMGLEVGQLRKAGNYHLAYYSPDWVERLGLQGDHNSRVDKKNFSDYDFESAILIEADLSNAILTNAHLDGVDLKNADLTGADLSGATLVDADLLGADLMEINLTDDGQLSKVKSLYKTKMDIQLKHRLEKKYPHLFIKPQLGKEEIPDHTS